MVYGSLEYPSSFFDLEGNKYEGLVGFLKVYKLTTLFTVFIVFAISGLLTSILSSYTKVLESHK